MNLRHVFGILALVCVGVTTLAGCSRSPRVDFYTLSPVAKLEAASPAAAPTVAVASVTVPDLVDRPQLVVRVDGSRVDILETHRWAEPLKNAIPRLLAENLSRLLGGARVSAYPQNAADATDYRVIVDLQRFESAGSFVLVDALWTIRRSTGATKAGRAQIREPNSGQGYDALVATYDRALLSISSDIAGAIGADWAVTR
jgi:uncharacterized protein